MPISFNLPFAQNTGSLGFFEFTSTELEAVKANIRSVLVTNWGERVMHYYFGCNLREFLFRNERGDELKQQIADRIIDQVSKWLPYVQIKKLTIVFGDEDRTGTVPANGIGITIGFVMTTRPDVSAFITAVV